MGVRTIGLGLAAVVVLGGGLYLFLQVTSDPGAPAVAARDDRPAPRDQPVPPSAGSAIRFSPTTPRTGSATIKKPITPTGDTTPATTTATPPALDTDDPGTNPDVDLDTAMDEANKLYDVNDYEAASKQALRVLAKHPDNIRMLRIV